MVRNCKHCNKKKNIRLVRLAKKKNWEYWDTPKEESTENNKSDLELLFWYSLVCFMAGVAIWRIVQCVW